MKKVCSALIFAALMVSGFSQKRVQPASAVQYDADLLLRAKHKSVAGAVMVTVGSVMAAGGAGMLLAGAFGNGNGYHSTSNDNLQVAGIVTGLAGTGLALASIPVFVKSHRLRKEARLVFGPGNMRFRLPVNQTAAISRMQAGFKM